MSQCPACLSHNPGSVAYCGHCGARVRGPTGKSGSAGRYFLAAFVVTVLVVVLAWVVSIAHQGSVTRLTRSPGDSRSDPHTGRPESTQGDRDGQRATQDAPRELRVPTRHEVVSNVTAALVVCELRDRENRPWKQIRGLLVDPSGAVLCRYEPLLGAYGGVCRLGNRARARVEIAGLAYRDENLNLALLRLRSAPTDYPFVPLLVDAPWTLLARGDPLFVFTDYKPIRATVSAPYHRDLEGRERLVFADEPLLPAESFCALDSYGLVVGLCAPLGEPAVNGRVSMVLDPSFGLEANLGAPVLFTLQALTVSSFEGTFQDLVSRGETAWKRKDWAAAIEHFEAALDRVPYDSPLDSAVQLIRAKLLQAYHHEVDRLHQGGDLSEAGRTAEAGLTRYGESSKLWLCLGEWQLAENQLTDSISALLQAQELEASRAAMALLESAYLQLYEETAERGDERAIEAVLLEAMERVPDSGTIRLELAELNYRLGAFDEAYHLAAEAPRLNSTLRGAAEDLQKRIERELNARDAVVIPISSDSSSYRTEAVVDGALAVNFIIDTGATSTTLPQSVMDQLGYDTRRGQQVTVRTAGGLMQAPLVRIASLDVHGYVVRNLQVLVLPNGTPPLLGLNFLKYFRYTVDATRREFRLERS